MGGTLDNQQLKFEAFSRFFFFFLFLFQDGTIHTLISCIHIINLQPFCSHYTALSHKTLLYAQAIFFFFFFFVSLRVVTAS